MKKNELSEKLLEELKKLNLNEQEQDNDGDDNDMVDSEDTNEDFCDLVCNLLHSQTQSHVYHLGTTSYSEHKALQDYYSKIDDLIDGLVESYQGKYGLIKNYKTFKINSYKNKKQVIAYYLEIIKKIDSNRETVKENYIQSQLDVIEELIHTTIYKLKFLN